MILHTTSTCSIYYNNYGIGAYKVELAGKEGGVHASIAPFVGTVTLEDTCMCGH